jgi:IclR family acetate operon transcriptional repressor
MTAHTVKRFSAAPGAGAPTHQSLERGLRIVEVVASNGALTSLAEIARRTGLHRSTAHHLLRTLVDLGYLRQDFQSRGYELAAKVFHLTGRTWSPEQLGSIAEPLIAELARETGEGSSVAVYRDGVVQIVAKRDADGPVRVVQNVGADRPIHATAVGKAIVAFLPSAELSGVLARLTFTGFTARTIVARPAFEAELQRIRASGVAIDDEEHIEGIRCIAAPIFAYNGQVVASICTVGSKVRMTRRKIRDLRGPLLDFSRRLSERLGWEDSRPALARRA